MRILLSGGEPAVRTGKSQLYFKVLGLFALSFGGGSHFDVVFWGGEGESSGLVW